MNEFEYVWSMFMVISSAVGGMVLLSNYAIANIRLDDFIAMDLDNFSDL